MPPKAKAKAAPPPAAMPAAPTKATAKEAAPAVAPPQRSTTGSRKRARPAATSVEAPPAAAPASDGDAGSDADAATAAAAAAAPPAAMAAAAAAPLPRATTSAAALAAAVPYANKQRVLVFGSRGLTSRYRHLMLDVRAMLPHHKKDSKLDTKDNLATVNEIAEMKGCSTTIFFDVRKKRDLFVWLAHTPSGPSVKFHAVNVHTMDELRLTGNCLKGSRPILSFDRAFDDEAAAPHLAVVRELFTQAFATPRGHPKSQPFHDHVVNVGYADGKVWVRHYQIVDTAADAKAAAKMLAEGEQPTVLVEIGPRFVLDIVRVFAGSMGGATLWSNPRYVAPNAVRHEAALVRAGKYGARQRSKQERADRDDELAPVADPLADVFR